MRKILVLALGIVALPMSAASEEPRVGVVATVVGTASVVHVTHPQPALLKLRDGVFVRDEITTGERSFVRVLLGGKAAVSAREHSVLRITERPSVSTVALAAGRIATAVSKDRMKPGEMVEIRVPNAIVAIRGTVVIAEVSPTPAGLRSTITILRGVVEVRRFDPVTDQPVGAPVSVNALERITVVGGGPLPAPEAITTEAAQRLAGEFTVIPKDAPRMSREASTRFATDLALRDLLQGATNTASLAIGGSAVGEAVTGVTSSVSTLGGLTAPFGGLTAPLGSLTAPLAGPTAPLGDLTAPLGGLTAPLTGLTAPLGGLTAPLGGLTAPLGGVTAPLVTLPLAPKLP